MIVGYSSYPSTAHNGGDLTETEYEQYAAVGFMHSALDGLPTDPALVYADSSGRQVKFRANRGAWVRGQRFDLDGSGDTEAIAANSSGQTRYDLATLRFDRTSQLVTPHIITGTPGSGIPSPVRDPIGTGVWDFTCASVKVVNGASNLAGSDVVNLGVYIGEPTYLCTSTTRPDHRMGRRIYESDTQIEYTSNGTKWFGPSEDTDWIEISAAPDWAKTALRIRRLNGVEYMQLFLTRTGADLDASTDSLVATVPGGHRPPFIKHINVYIDGGNTGRCKIDSNTGQVTLQSYALMYKTGSGSTEKWLGNGPLKKGMSISADEDVTWAL